MPRGKLPGRKVTLNLRFASSSARLTLHLSNVSIITEAETEVLSL